MTAPKMNAECSDTKKKSKKAERNLAEVALDTDDSIKTKKKKDKKRKRDETTDESLSAMEVDRKESEKPTKSKKKKRQIQETERDTENKDATTEEKKKRKSKKAKTDDDESVKCVNPPEIDDKKTLKEKKKAKKEKLKEEKLKKEQKKKEKKEKRKKQTDTATTDKNHSQAESVTTKKSSPKKKEEDLATSNESNSADGKSKPETADKQSQSKGWTDWTLASFSGDEQRKDKFLRLLGMKKSSAQPSTTNHSTASLNRTGSSTIINESKIMNEMERQFEHALELDRMRRKGGRVGLGA